MRINPKKIAIPLAFLFMILVLPHSIKDASAAQFYPSVNHEYDGVETFHVIMKNGTDLGFIDRISIWEVNMFYTYFRYMSAPKGINLGPFLRAMYPSAAIGEKYTGYGRMNITYGPRSGDWLTMNITPCFELENGTILTDLSSLGINTSNFTPLGMELSVTSMLGFPPARQVQVNATNFTQRYRDSPANSWTYSPSSYHVNESQCIVGNTYWWNGNPTLSTTIARNATDIVILHDNTTTYGNQHTKYSTYTSDGEIKTVVEQMKYNSSGDPYGYGLGSISRTFDYTGYIPDYIPSASFFINSTYIAVNDWVQFSFSGRGGNKPYTFQWNFDDGSQNSSEKNPAHKFTTTGNYTIRLTIRDGDGDIASQYMQIVVHQRGIWGWDYDYFIVILIIGIAAAIVAYTAYDRRRKRVRLRAKRDHRAPWPREPGPAIVVADISNSSTPVLEYTIFSKNLLDKIDKMELNEDHLEDLLTLLSQVDPEKRFDYLDNIFNERPDFDGNF